MRSWSVIKQIAVSLNHNITLGTIPNQNLWISDNTQPTLLFFQYTSFSFILAFDQTNQFDRNKKKCHEVTRKHMRCFTKGRRCKVNS